MVFLQILLAVAVVIVVLTAVVIWWSKRRYRLNTEDMEKYAGVGELLQHVYERPARLHLIRAEQQDGDSEDKAQIAQLDSLGFRRIANLVDRDYREVMLSSGDPLTVYAARHTQWPIAAAILSGSVERRSIVLFALDRTRRVVARGKGPGANLQTPRLDWQIAPETSLESALGNVRELLNEEQLPIDLRIIRAVIEQVYALEMDRTLAHRPTLDSIRRLADEHKVEISDDNLEVLLQLRIAHWIEQVADAALDRYRRTSKIDAVEWEELNEEIHVVHEGLGDDNIRALLIVDDVGEQVYDSCVAQGLSGVDLYRAVASRLPADQQWVEFSHVDTPMRAALFKPNESIASEETAAGRYVYSAVDSEGKRLQGAVAATSSGDAKAQLAQLGLTDTRILIEPSPDDDAHADTLVHDDSGAIAAKAVTESIAVSALRAIGGNWLIWAPPLAFLAKSLYDGPPYGWGDYNVFVLSALALGATLFLVAPLVLYNRLQLAGLKAKPRVGMFLLRALRATTIFGFIGESELRKERCRFLIMSGKIEEALSLWETERGNLSEAEYQTGLVTIFDTAGDFERMMSAQRKLVDLSPAPETSIVDLAMAIARFAPEVDEAEKLIQSVSPSELPEVGVGGYQYARGIIAFRRDKHELALKHYAQALETFGQFASMPIMLGLIAEINGYVALALKCSGNPKRAAELWKDVLPILERHASMEPLVSRYNAA